MGKPFKEELSKLGATYDWALDQDITSLSTFLRSNANQPLRFVGSGGSFSAATFAAYLQEQFTTQIAEAITPLQFSAKSELQLGGVLMMSAGGKNRDILSAMNQAVRRDIRQIAIACFAPGSRLVEMARKIWAVESFANRIPAGSDGFLATNSLLAFFVLLARAYGDAGLTNEKLPRKLSTLRRTVAWTNSELTRTLKQRYILILCGPHCRPAAVDLESKLSEAALAAPQLLDFRNFAHGRHHWIAKHSEETGLIAFVSPDMADLADRTLNQLSKRIPIARIGLPESSINANVAALLAVFAATRIAGDLRGIDPGRPGVPEFGRRIYNLRFSSPPRSGSDAPFGMDHFVRRKFGAIAIQSHSINKQATDAACKYIEKLRLPTYGGIVFDYDGTLCSPRERFTALKPEVAEALTALLKCNISIGIASGRGQSVRRQMQDSIAQSLWDRVWIGYYNGSQLSRLSDDTTPDLRQPVEASISQLDKKLRADLVISEAALITTRPAQITLEPKTSTLLTKDLWRYVSRAVHEYAALRVVFSSHSVDIIPVCVSKISVLGKLRELLSPECEILCVGDLGQYPGNDFELLCHPYSLSSDQVSVDPHSCWNLSPVAVYGVQATLYYLRHMKITGHTFKLVLPQARVQR